MNNEMSFMYVRMSVACATICTYVRMSRINLIVV